MVVSIQLKRYAHATRTVLSVFHNYKVDRIFFLFPVPCSLFPVP
ncbi:MULTISPECIES: hypothetical protein [unclassified Moorena]|nr:MULTISPECIES: hypothetical protein [unclassified Moorena]